MRSGELDLYFLTLKYSCPVSCNDLLTVYDLRRFLVVTVNSEISHNKSAT